MRRMLLIYCAGLILAGISFGFLVLQSIISIETQMIPSEAIQGKRIFQRKACVECHTVFGNGGYWGGDLTKAYNRLGHERIIGYLTAAPLLSGAKNKRHEQLTTEEAEQVSAYLQFVNSINTLDWPPSANK